MFDHIISLMANKMCDCLLCLKAFLVSDVHSIYYEMKGL